MNLGLLNGRWTAEYQSNTIHTDLASSANAIESDWTGRLPFMGYWTESDHNLTSNRIAERWDVHFTMRGNADNIIRHIFARPKDRSYEYMNLYVETSFRGSGNVRVMVRGMLDGQWDAWSPSREVYCTVAEDE